MSDESEVMGPISYLVVEPEDTTDRTVNLQQANVMGFRVPCGNRLFHCYSDLFDRAAGASHGSPSSMSSRNAPLPTCCQRVRDTNRRAAATALRSDPAEKSDTALC